MKEELTPAQKKIIDVVSSFEDLKLPNGISYGLLGDKVVNEGEPNIKSPEFEYALRFLIESGIIRRFYYFNTPYFTMAEPRDIVQKRMENQ